jgi:hypothetical protein
MSSKTEILSFGITLFISIFIEMNNLILYEVSSAN